VARSFNDLSMRAQMLTFVGLCVLIVAGAWQVVLGPARVELASQESRVATLEAEVARAQVTAAKLPVVQREVAVMELSLKQTTAILPDEKDPQDVLRNLHELASESALDISSFTPKAISTKTQYSEWPIQVGLEGGYHDLGRFFDRIATMSRLMSVTELQIKVNAKPNARSVIAATCVATTFVFKKDIASVAPGAGVAPAMAGGGK
jgi:Tfp pilus assembly protein PilO